MRARYEISFFRRGATVLSQPDYVSSVGLLRILEKRILSAADLERIADAPSAAEALRLIGAAAAYDFSQIKFPEQYEQVLRPAQAELFEFCYELSAEPEPVDIVACRYLFHNLKTALKARLCGADDTGVYSPISVPEFSAEQLKAALMGEGELPGYLKEAADAAEQAYARSKNPQAIDIAVDKAQLSHQLSLAGKIGSELILSFTRRQIDYYNLLSTLRAKSMGQPAVMLGAALIEGGQESAEYYLTQFAKSHSAMAAALFFRPFGKVAQRGIEAYERTGSFAALERLMDNDLLDHARLAKRVAFGPEVIFGYLIAKENELRQIRMVMAAKINRLSTERLRERLRENYV